MELRQIAVCARFVFESSAKIESEIRDVLQLRSNAGDLRGSVAAPASFENGVTSQRSERHNPLPSEKDAGRYCMKLKVAAFPVVIPAVA
jgi:hypothetical protein